MKIIVTGASGFLGQGVVRAALDAGHEVVGADIVPGSLAGHADGYSELLLDLFDAPALLKNELDGADAVVHAAALIAGDPEAIRRTNVKGTQALLHACSGRDRLRFVLLSSMAVTESFPGAYSLSKKEAEAAVAERAANRVILRPTMVYGKNDRGWTASLERRVTRKLPLFLPGGGTNMIQPVFVDDAAKAVVAAAATKEAAGATFEIGGPEPVKQVSFLREARKALNGKTVLVPVPLWLLRPAALFLGSRIRATLAFFANDHTVNISSARKTLGFAPRGHEQGLSAAFGE